LFFYCFLFLLYVPLPYTILLDRFKKAMVKKEKHQIQFEELESDFSQHLDISDNQRILFTAPFGQGKSTFLNSFFHNKESQSQYLVIKLYPVHYSVSPNEDIFELIK